MNSRHAFAAVILALTLSLAAGTCYARGGSSGGSRGHATGGHVIAPPSSHGTTASIRTPPYLNTATSHIGTTGRHR